MSMSVQLRRLRAGVRRRRRGSAGCSPSGRTLVRPRYLAMLAQVKYFHRRARARAGRAATTELTLQEFLTAGRFTEYFTNHFMLPLVSAVWSCGFDGARGYPARYLFTFLDNHGMLTVTGSPQWRTVVGGSRNYVERAAKNLSAVQHRDPDPVGHPACRRRRDPGRRRPAAPGGPGRPRRPIRTRRCACWPTRRRTRPGCSAPSSTCRRRRVLHTDGSVLPAQPGGAGVLELPDGQLRVRRQAGQDQLRPQAAAADHRRRRLRRHAERRTARSTRPRCWPR